MSEPENVSGYDQVSVLNSHGVALDPLSGDVRNPFEEPTTPRAALATLPAPVIAAEQEPWAQMLGEPDRDFARFRLYLEMGARGLDGLPKPRSLKKLAEGLEMSKDNAYRLSSKWDWNTRAQAWDRRRPQTFEEETDENLRRAMRLTSAALSDIETDGAEGRSPFKDEQGRLDPKGLTAVANVLAQLNQSKRLIDGKSTSNQSVHVSTSKNVVRLRDLGDLAQLAVWVAGENARALEANEAKPDTPFHQELAYYEHIAKLLPYESRHKDTQIKLLAAAEYLLQVESHKHHNGSAACKV